MAIILDSVTRISPTLARVAWHATAGEETFYVWVNGRYAGSTTETTYDVPVPPRGQVQFDIFDSAATVPVYFPGYAVLQPEVEADAIQFKFYKKVGVEWVLRQIIPVGEAPVVQYRSELLAEGTHEFRVEAVDAAGVSSTARDIVVKIVRYPNPANVEATYNGALSATFTVAAKASGLVEGEFG
jgi:hypothetical protein